MNVNQLAGNFGFQAGMPPPERIGEQDSVRGLYCLSSKKRVPLSPKGIRIGRHVENEIHFVDEACLSRFHAKISRRMCCYWIEDCVSTNGTYVNGLPVKGPQILEVGDRVEIGPLEFIVE